MTNHVSLIYTLAYRAGVLGLSSALTLLENLPPEKFEVLLVASHFPTDPPHPSYATTNAGAHYRPIPATTQQLKDESQLAQFTHEKFKKLAIAKPELGVKLLEGIDYVSGDAAPAYKALLPEYTSVDGFRVLRKDEMPAGVEFGARYDSYTVDTETYMFHLLRRFRIDGGQLLRKHLDSASEAFYFEGRDVRLVINCSGMGFGDPKSFIIRGINLSFTLAAPMIIFTDRKSLLGQTCLVSNPCGSTITQQNADGTWTFTVPRALGGGTIVGGTKQVNDWDPNPSLAVREELLKNVAKLYPALLGAEGKLDVIRDVVGRRPAREGGLRLEVEKLPDQRNIVHAYGAGGRGFELSWGVAEEVWNMVKSTMPALSKL